MNADEDSKRSISAFRLTAQRYCDLIDVICTDKQTPFYGRLLESLSSLACTGFHLPWPAVTTDSLFQETTDGSSNDKWSSVSRTINAATAVGTSQLADYLKSFDENDTEIYMRVGMLFDDLADIYRDLKTGLMASRDADELPSDDVVWQWRWGYENHWGEHLFRALQTVHEIRFRLFLD